MTTTVSKHGWRTGVRTALVAALAALALTGCRGDSGGVVIGVSATAGPAPSGTLP